jgi:gas vesicle protein
MSNNYDYRWADNANANSSQSHGTPGWVVGLVAGAALGSGLALLFAPRQGTDTRHQLATRGQEAGRQLRQAYESVAGTARRNARRLTEQAQDWSRQRTGTRGSASDMHDYAKEHSTSDTAQIVRGALGEMTYTPANAASSGVGTGTTSPAPSEPRSPFA